MYNPIGTILSATGNDLSTMSEDEIKVVLKAIENVNMVGEMFTSAAAWDPLFWPLHGSIERLLGYKRMNVDLYGLDFDDTWGYPEYDGAAGPYLNAYCDWSNVTEVYDLPSCTASKCIDMHYSMPCNDSLSLSLSPSLSLSILTHDLSRTF